MVGNKWSASRPDYLHPRNNCMFCRIQYNNLSLSGSEFLSPCCSALNLFTTQTVTYGYCYRGVETELIDSLVKQTAE